jgi:Na+-driven multidrug efflux pump
MSAEICRGDSGNTDQARLEMVTGELANTLLPIPGPAAGRLTVVNLLQLLKAFSQMVAVPLIPLGVLVNMTVQAADRPIQAVVLAVLRQGICLIPFLLLLPLWFQERGLYFAQPLADIFTFMIALFFLRRFFKQSE